MTVPLQNFAWKLRLSPLIPCGAVGKAEAAKKLIKRLSLIDDDVLKQLHGVIGQEIVIILGDEGLLPWVEGIFYLGKDSQAPNLYLPTYLEPAIPLSLIDRAVCKGSNAQGPWAILVPQSKKVSLNTARPLSRSILKKVKCFPSHYL